MNMFLSRLSNRQLCQSLSYILSYWFLFIIRFPQLQQYQRGGLASQVVNAPSVVNAPNVLCLQVSSLPYNLQTNKSRIAKGNEIFMETCQYQVSQICSLKFAEFMIIYYSFVCKLKKCNKPRNMCKNCENWIICRDEVKATSHLMFDTWICLFRA